MSTAEIIVNRVLREFKRYTGDGFPGEPTGAPLPVGDPSSGVNSPTNAELRAMLIEVVSEAQMWAESAELVALPDGSIDAAKLTNDTTKLAAIFLKINAGNGRDRLAGARTYYVRTDGSDANTGLANTSGAAFLTIQKAVDWVADKLDLNGFDVTIRVADGAYSAGALASGHWTGRGRVIIQGNVVTPASVAVAVTGNNAFVARDGAALRLGGFKTTTTGTGSNVLVDKGHVAIFGGWEFGSTAGSDLEVQSLGSISVETSYSISGTKISHCHTPLAGGIITIGAAGAVTVTLIGTPAFSAYYAGTAGGTITIPKGIVTFVGSATGTRWYAHTSGTINCGGDTTNAYLPGNAGGITQSGGRYIGYESDHTGVAAANLPSAANGRFNTYMVTDALSPAVGSFVASGGSTIVYVTSDGTNWRVAQIL